MCEYLQAFRMFFCKLQPVIHTVMLVDRSEESELVEEGINSTKQVNSAVLNS